MKEIEPYIESYFGIKKQDVPKIARFFAERQIEKGTYLLKEGQYQTSLSFLKSGYIRIFKIDDKSGKEITQWISTPGTFVADVSALFFDTPAKWDIQSLSSCELFTISQDNFKQIGHHIKQWDKLEKLFMAKCFNMLEHRVYSHLSMTSEERYRFFFENNPTLFNQVPLQYIASMLGMTPETFSRIRKKLSS